MSNGIYMILNKFDKKVYIGQSTNIKERFWEHKKCYNFAYCVNNPMKGRKHTEKTKAKISKSLKGKNNNRPMSEETKQNMRVAQKNRKHSETEIERLKTLNIGRKASEETKKKLREAHRKNPKKCLMKKNKK